MQKNMTMLELYSEDRGKVNLTKCLSKAQKSSQKLGKNSGQNWSLKWSLHKGFHSHWDKKKQGPYKAEPFW